MWVHETSLTLPLFIEMLVPRQEHEQLCNCIEVSIWHQQYMGTAQLVFVEDPCGGSRGYDHCACLTGSDVTGSHVTFPPYFPVLFSPVVFLFPYFFSPYFFPRIFFSSSSTKCWLGCSLRRPRPITIGNYYPFYFHILGVLYDVRVLQPQETTPPLLFSYIRCSLRRPRPITIGSYPSFYFHILQCICCVVLEGCPRPITFYELALIIIYPFYFHNYISIMVFGYVVQYSAFSLCGISKEYI